MFKLSITNKSLYFKISIKFSSRALLLSFDKLLDLQVGDPKSNSQTITI